LLLARDLSEGMLVGCSVSQVTAGEILYDGAFHGDPHDGDPHSGVHSDFGGTVALKLDAAMLVTFGIIGFVGGMVLLKLRARFVEAKGKEKDAGSGGVEGGGGSGG
jgi:hypothetical protein